MPLKDNNQTHLQPSNIMRGVDTRGNHQAEATETKLTSS